jgi:hypothetical protein
MQPQASACACTGWKADIAILLQIAPNPMIKEGGGTPATQAADLPFLLVTGFDEHLEVPQFVQKYF